MSDRLVDHLSLECGAGSMLAVHTITGTLPKRWQTWSTQPHQPTHFISDMYRPPCMTSATTQSMTTNHQTNRTQPNPTDSQGV